LYFEFHAHHAPLLDSFDLEHETVMLDHVAGLQHVTGLRHQEPADCRVAFGFRH